MPCDAIIENPVINSPFRDLLIGIEAGKSFKALGRPAEDGEWGVIKVSAIEDAVDASLRRSRHLRQTVLQKAFTGGLRRGDSI